MIKKNNILSIIIVLGLFSSTMITASAASLVGRWKLDDNAANASVVDDTGNHDGTFIDSNNANTSYHHSDDAMEGTGSLFFDGIDDYIQITAYKGITGLASRTCAAWIKTQQVADIISWGNDTVNGEKWLVRINDTGALRVEVAGGYIYGSTSIIDGQWHHVTVVLSNDGTPNISEVKLYVDGQLETDTTATSQSINTANTLDVEIGCFSKRGNRFFNGLIDDVRIYDYALSASEILQMLPDHNWRPSPFDNSTNVPISTSLSWIAGQNTLSHDVYFGTNQNIVANAKRLTGDINGDGPVNMDDLLVLTEQWQTDPGSVNHSADIVFSNHVDIADFAALASDWHKTPDAEFKGNQTSTIFDPGALDLNMTYYWRVDDVAPDDSHIPWKGTVWSFTTQLTPTMPGLISEPCPPNGESNIWKDIDLSWTQASDTTSYKVYLSTDSTIDAGDYQGEATDTTYPLNTLAYNTTYWWRVDAVNSNGTTTGTVYSFTTESGTRLTPEQFPIVAWDIAKSSDYYTKPVLATMRACGFNVAGIIKPKNLDNVAAAGMKMFIIDFNVPTVGYSYPATDALVTANQTTINTVVNYEVANYGSHPATYGYFVRDEPLSDTLSLSQLFGGIGNWVDAYRTADPSHKAYVSLGWGQTGYDWSYFLDYVDNDFLSYDWYGIRTDDGDITQYVEPYYFPILEKARAAADSSGLPLWNMGASIKMYNPDTAMPDLANLRFQAFTSLAYGVKGLFWFTYFSNDATMPAPITNFSKTDFWDDLQTVNMAIHKIGPILLTFDSSCNTFHYPNVPTGYGVINYPSQNISKSWYVSAISGGDYVVGEFYDASYSAYLLVVNKSLTNTAHVNITFKSPYNNRTKYYVDDSDAQLKSFTQGQALAPGNGLLLKLPVN